jgi:NAD(P)-dependent dehydrogenase (short-subunit alcohol dehydrogenase family)
MPSALVTGAARGIGRSIVIRLAANGWHVVAGVRNEQDAAAITAVEPRLVSPVLLDVTDPDHIAGLHNSLPERLDAVVNNAGVVVAGAIETVAPAEFRRQFDVNVIGQVAVTQAALPRLRGAQGRIIMISSINGKLAFPLLGAYCASKFALEAAADALRMELTPWNIAVVLIEVAATDTDMWRDRDDLMDTTIAAMSAEDRKLYDGHFTGMKNSPMSEMFAAPPEKVAAVVERALTAPRPRDRYVVGQRLQLLLLSNLPTAVRDWLLRRAAGQPNPPKAAGLGYGGLLNRNRA